MKATRESLLVLASTALFASSPGLAATTIVKVGASNFTAGSGLITFSEVPLGTTNPVYAPTTYGGGAGSPTVSFAGFFTGQRISSTPSVDCPGAAATACVVGTPTGPLSLSATSPQTRTVSDGSNPTSPVLSGSPTFNGPVAALFSFDVAGVGFDGGFFNAVGSTGITAFARDGTLLGTVANTRTGIEFLGLTTADGSNAIAGVFLDLVGAEPGGFAIDNLRFGSNVQVIAPGIPEPATWAMMIGGFGMVGGAMRSARRKRKVSVSYA